jgi:hypothetical protein
MSCYNSTQIILQGSTGIIHFLNKKIVHFFTVAMETYLCKPYLIVLVEGVRGSTVVVGVNAPEE